MARGLFIADGNPQATPVMNNFRDFIQQDRVRVFDGAMGTMIYSKGVYINRSYDELNLSAPELIADIHREYIKAGAEIIETNTFGASRPRLAVEGLDDKLQEINAPAVRELTNEHVIFAQVTINERGETAYGTPPEIFTQRLDRWLNQEGLDVIGLNCSVGPQIILEAIEKMRPHTTRRLSAQPNAGN